MAVDNKYELFALSKRPRPSISLPSFTKDGISYNPKVPAVTRPFQYKADPLPEDELKMQLPLSHPIDSRTNAFLKSNRILACRIDELMNPIQSEFGNVKCRLELDDASEFHSVFILVPFSGSVQDALTHIDAIDKIRSTFSPAERFALQVEVEFV